VEREVADPLAGHPEVLGEGAAEHGVLVVPKGLDPAVGRVDEPAVDLVDDEQHRAAAPPAMCAEHKGQAAHLLLGDHVAAGVAGGVEDQGAGSVVECGGDRLQVERAVLG
jgi:hypothetical protein